MTETELIDTLCRRVAAIPGDVGAVVRRHVRAVAPLADEAQQSRLVDAAVARLAGLDGLDALMADCDVDEILVNAGGEVWVERAGRLHAAQPLPPSAIPVVLERVLAPLGRRLDRTNPIVDARLADGSRVCAVIGPVAVDGAAVSIRRFRRRPLPLAAFTSAPVIELLAEVLRRRCNIVVSGATSSGKTSLLAALLGLAEPGERIIVLEDTAELQLANAHVVRLEARPSTPDGIRPIPLDELVRTALRLRPDRLVVGEVRGNEVTGLVQAMNTGHDGSLATCHANGPIDALLRLETLVMQAAPSWPLAAIRAQLSRSIDVIIHVARTTTAARQIVDVVEVVAGDERPAVRPLVAGSAVTGDLERRRSSWT
jgi:pilus assembly protein CpaF